METVLEVARLVVRYGTVTAVDGVDLDVGAHEVVGLIGPNGAGKSSLIDALTGYVTRTGSVRFVGHDIAGLPAHAVARRGLVRTFQSVELFDDLTVEDNLQVAAARPGIWGPLRDLVVPSPRTSDTDVAWALDLLDITALAPRFPGELSLGQRKLVGVARALALRPRLLLLDEPAAGLDTEESVALGRHLRRLPDQGVAVLLVDHDMGLVLGVCDRIVVVDFGRVIACGTPAEIRSDPRVIEAYLGGAA